MAVSTILLESPIIQLRATTGIRHLSCITNLSILTCVLILMLFILFISDCCDCVSFIFVIVCCSVVSVVCISVSCVFCCCCVMSSLCCCCCCVMSSLCCCLFSTWAYVSVVFCWWRLFMCCLILSHCLDVAVWGPLQFVHFLFLFLFWQLLRGQFSPHRTHLYSLVQLVFVCPSLLQFVHCICVLFM